MSIASPTKPIKPLRGIRILSLALNVPGPMALLRLAAMGARCTKVEPPGGDPMYHYNPEAYDGIHQGIRRLTLDLRTEAGQKALDKHLARTDVLLTSFRPSGLARLGLDWKPLHKRHPALSQVAIVGAPGARAEEPGHDLTYMAENDLVTGLDLPPTLYADMGGSLMASEAVLQAVLHKQRSGKGVYLEVALSSASAYLGLPRSWGLTQPSGAGGRGPCRIPPLPLQGRARGRCRPRTPLRRRLVRSRRRGRDANGPTCFHPRPMPQWPGVSPAEPAPSLTPWARPGIFPSTP